MKVGRRLLLTLPIVAALALPACTPEDQEFGDEDRGSAAPDLTSETQPPPVPPPPGDTSGIVETAPPAP